MKSILLSAGLLAYGLSSIIKAGTPGEINLLDTKIAVDHRIHVDPMPINVNPTTFDPIMPGANVVLPKIDPFFAFRSGCTGAISSDIVINGNFSDNQCNN